MIADRNRDSPDGREAPDAVRTCLHRNGQCAGADRALVKWKHQHGACICAIQYAA